MTCTWEFYDDPDDETIITRECGNTASLVFSKDDRTFPRCLKHASEKIRITAQDQGYDIHYLEPQAVQV